MKEATIVVLDGATKEDTKRFKKLLEEGLVVTNTPVKLYKIKMEE